MIRLYQFPPSERVSDISPFCLKVETYLRMVGLEYESVYWDNPRKAPKGKLPFIEDGGEKIADSGLILQYLAKKYPNNLDSSLKAEDHAVGLAMRRMLEEHFYWVLVYSRWVDKRYAPAVIKATFGELSWPIRPVVTCLAIKKAIKLLHSQGLGRHSREEIYQRGLEDLNAIAQMFGEKRFLFGEQPTSFDATAFAFLAGLFLVKQPETPLQRTAISFKNLEAYVKGVANRYFPELL